MALPEHWAKPEDFAALFQYFWHRDFPMHQEKATGAKRIDWTIHIGVIVRNIADLMGLVTRFERGGRKDALLRSSDGDELAIEWEWQGVHKSELSKLKSHKGWPEGKQIKYAVLITYANVDNFEDDFESVKKYWADAEWPLLLILICSKKSRLFSSGRDFDVIRFYLIDSSKQIMLRESPAVPWNVGGSRWQLL
jgi:hypothetical protein